MDVMFHDEECVITFPWPPPREKDEVKKLGAKWDVATKTWRIPLSPTLLRWLERHEVDIPGMSVSSIDEILNASRATETDITVPAPDGLEYRPFQKAGVAWALDHASTLIGDDMGLGKTIQALGVVNADDSTRSVLVVCPLSVALNWKAEAEKWLIRKMTIGVASGKDWPTTDIVIAHWGILAKHSQTVRSRNWDLVVLDEAHYAKNPRSGRTKAIFGDRKAGLLPLNAKRKLALTGTPIPNRPIEIYPMLKWLAPQEFGNWMEFATRYCGGYRGQFGWDVSGASNLNEFQERLRSAVMIRRLKKDVLTELPAKTRQLILIAADTTDQRKALESEKSSQKKSAEALVRAKAAVELAKAGTPDDYKQAVAKLREEQGVAFTEMSRVRHETALAKTPQTLEHVKDVLAGDGQKIVLFAHHRDVINILRDGLETESGDWPGVKTVSIVGGDSAEDRQEAVHSFQNDPSVRVFIGSIGAAREGITLTAADIAVFAEIDWVPGNLSQAEDRLHRIGQHNAVTIQHVLLDNSLDAKMIKTIVSKQRVLDKALDEQNPLDDIGELDATRDYHAEDEGSAELDVTAGSTGKTATGDTTREQIAKRAEWITEHDIALVRQGLSLLAGSDTDFARVRNDVGFSKVDAAIGHDLANRPTLSPKQAALGAKLIAKYHRQMPEEISGLWQELAKRGTTTPTPPTGEDDDEKPQPIPTVRPGKGMGR